MNFISPKLLSHFNEMKAAGRFGECVISEEAVIISPLYACFVYDGITQLLFSLEKYFFSCALTYPWDDQIERNYVYKNAFKGKALNTFQSQYFLQRMFLLFNKILYK